MALSRCSCGPARNSDGSENGLCEACERDRDEIEHGQTEEDIQALADNGGVFPVGIEPEELFGEPLGEDRFVFASPFPDTEEGRAREKYAARVAELQDALALILPLAKGYAAAHRVGNNAAHVEHAVALITCHTCEGPLSTGPWGATDCIACNPPLGRD